MVIKLIKVVYIGSFEIYFFFSFHLASALVDHRPYTHLLEKNRLRFFHFVKILSNWMLLEPLSNIRTTLNMSDNNIILRTTFLRNADENVG